MSGYTGFALKPDNLLHQGLLREETIMDPLKASFHMLIPDNSSSHQSQVTQLQHRINLIETWRLLGFNPHKSTVLEIGCGQGDQTAALLLTPDEEIYSLIAIDPGEPDYGSPFTLAQAQAKLAESPLAEGTDMELSRNYRRLHFCRHDAVSFFTDTTFAASLLSQTKSRVIDVAILSHSLWYFPDTSAVLATLQALKQQKIPQLCIAEWALQTTKSAALYYTAQSSLPHLLAVLAQSLLPMSDDRNIRLPLSPAQITALAVQAGWRLKKEEILPGPKGMRDGEWEVYAAEAMNRAGPQGTERLAATEALRVAVEAIGGKKEVTCMDVWCAVFE